MIRLALRRDRVAFAARMTAAILGCPRDSGARKVALRIADRMQRARYTALRAGEGSGS